RIISAAGTLRIWDASNGEQLVALSGRAGAVHAAAFSPDGRFIAVENFDHALSILDTERGPAVFWLPPPAVGKVAYSPDGKRVVSGGADKTLRIWDAETGQGIGTFVVPASIACVAFSPDGKQVVTGGYEKMVRVWDAESGREVLAFSGHEGS